MKNLTKTIMLPQIAKKASKIWYRVKREFRSFKNC